MLEIRNVSKTYKPKKGVPVKALNDVSVKFADTGMVFILGKSGSGKSTLLNVLGGLDQADCGEFVIKGKSSKDFTQADFDSYRNTFVGFIFQEYNILPEFTVGANIALAMELQGKKADNQSLNTLLDEVDLTGYGNRKPNELSGGQKQRVAIARALIKSPEIIMADEPTGALDSKTGIQVMDTLKKLSKTKLVLIVSHDRDFAEQYGDRIIELKDGKIIADTTKTNVAPTQVNEGVCVLDDGLLRVKKGYTLTTDDLNLINEYLGKADSDTFISTDGKTNDGIKQAVGISEDGCKERFEDTQDDTIKIKQYSIEDSKLIRSRLPYKNSLKIGASSLKSKPFRLVLTILLCIIAFTMFGLVDTISAYDSNVVIKQSIKDENIDHASFVKYYVPEENMYGERSLKLNDNDIAQIKQDTGIDVIPVFSGLGWDNGFSLSNALYEVAKLDSKTGVNYYNCKVSGLASLNQDLLQNMGYSLKGRLPQNDDEIAISQYVFEHFALAGINCYDPTQDKTTSLGKDDIASFEDVEGKLVLLPTDWGLPVTVPSLELCAYKIVGLFDTNLVHNEKYSKYMPSAEANGSANTMMDMLNAQELESMLSSGLHSVIGLTQNTMNAVVKYANDRQSNYTVSVGKSLGDEANIFFMNSDGSTGFSRSSHIATLEQMKNYADITWIDGEKTTLADGEVIVPFNAYNLHNRNVSLSTIAALEEAGYVIPDVEKEYLLQTRLAQFVVHEIQYMNIFAHLCKLTAADVPQAFRDSNPSFADLTDEEVLQYYQEYLRDNPYDNTYGKRGVDFYNEFLSVIYKSENATADYPTYGVLSFRNNAGKAPKDIEYSIVGYYIPNENYPETHPTCPLIFSNYVYDGFVVPEVGYYGYAVGKMPLESNAELDKLLQYAKTANGNGIKYSLSNQASFLLGQVDGLIKPLSQVFLYVGIALAVFASLMMFNFISVSISYKKREIGILRAVGARSSDVFGIFFNESLIITLINWVLASIATISVVYIINNMLRTQYGLVLTLLNVGIRQIALILAIGVVVAFVSSFIPVMNIARKRPIDAIQNR